MSIRASRTFGPVGDVGLNRVSMALGEIADYADRGGYDPAFVDRKLRLPLPGLGAWTEDAVMLLQAARQDDSDPCELKYTHFSVVMCASRRLPFFSAVNIDGKQSDRDVPRTNVWKRDPRIDVGHQVIREVYGDDKKGFFSRGHMTRREDPNWGDEDTTELADADTFHVTNACPQRQSFNAGIWLDLENYVLDNADDGDLRISVITGPIFREEDPMYYGLPVPTEFWKLIAFRHADTKEVTAIAYKRSQATYLPTQKAATYVFADFDDTQVSVRHLSEATGLDLSAFEDIDVLGEADPRLAIRLSSVTDAFLTR